MYDNLCKWNPHYSFKRNEGSGIMYQSKTKNSVMFSPRVTCMSHPPEKKTTPRTFMNVWKGFCKVQGHPGTSNSQFFEWIDKNGDLQPCSM